jgi:hypothetical protein
MEIRVIKYGDERGKHHMLKKLIYQTFVLFFLPGLLVVSCSSTIHQPIITATSQEVNSPVTSSNTLESAKTATMQSTQMIKTQTPTSFVIVTDTPQVCPPFVFDKGLPDPDIPENYIGYHLNQRELPMGLEYVGGSLVRDKNQQYELRVSKLDWHENSQLFWLERLICRDESGYPYFELVDSFATPPLSGTETEPWVCFDGETEIDFAGGLGLFDKSVPKVTIGDFQGWPYTKITFLFDIDFAAQQFILLDVDSLICLEGGRP